MHQRLVEVFIAGCPRCDEAIDLVQQMACTSCQVKIWDARTESIDATIKQKLEHYGIYRLPAVVVDGELVDC